MSLEVIRQAVTNAVEAAKVTFTEYPLVIEYDNRILVDTQTQVNPFLQVRVLILDGGQVDLSNDPLHRYIGQLHLAAVTKEGGGSAEANRLLEHFYPKLHKNSLGGVRTYMAKPSTPKPHLGWIYTPVLIPFWFDRTYGV